MHIQSTDIIEHLGPYHIYKHIAKGGMAHVSLAYQHTELGLQRRVIIKSVLPHLSRETDFITMFLDEARLMMSFSHPHIAQVFDVGVIDHRYFLSMEYIPGPTLAQVLKVTHKTKEPIPFDVCFTIALGLIEALNYVHQRHDAFGNWLSIIHRDLKPSNVLLRQDGILKLIDFGIAQAASKKHKTRTGVIKGTIGYLAPEQILDEKVDQRADVFTLGLLLFQIFIGRYPFPGKNDAMRLRRLMSGDALNPQTYRPNLPKSLNDLLIQCLAATPQERPFMADLLDTLVKCAREMSIVPHAQTLAQWLDTHLPNKEATNPEYLVQSLQQEVSELKPTATLKVKSNVIPIESQAQRVNKIDACIEDFHPLLDADTLFDTTLEQVYQKEILDQNALDPEQHIKPIEHSSLQIAEDGSTDDLDYYDKNFVDEHSNENLTVPLSRVKLVKDSTVALSIDSSPSTNDLDTKLNTKLRNDHPLEITTVADFYEQSKSSKHEDLEQKKQYSKVLVDASSYLINYNHNDDLDYSVSMNVHSEESINTPLESSLISSSDSSQHSLIDNQDLAPFDELLTQQLDIRNQVQLPFQKYRKKNPRLQIIKIVVLIMMIISLVCYKYLT
jgi:serine/threonine protein kinase